MMEVGNQRHVVSIDVLFDDEENPGRELSAKKNRLTILVGCKNKEPSRLSIRRNNGSVESKPAPSFQNAGQKYYFQRKNKREKRHPDGGLTERKCLNGVTAALCRGRQNSKSYRIHTIDYIQQDRKKEQVQRTSKGIFIDMTNKKHTDQFYGGRIKKKTIINQSDYVQFTTLTKNRKQKEGNTINVGHRKFNKMKTQFEDDHVVKDQKKGENALMSDRKLGSECMLRKIQFRKAKAKNILYSNSQRETVQMKNQVAPVEQGKQNKRTSHQNNFNEYLDFIERRKAQLLISRAKKLHNANESKSLIMKSTIIKETICLKVEQATEKLDAKPENNNFGEDPKQIVQETQKIKKINNGQFECSSISQINQSSFLSEAGKKEIIATSAFQLLQIPHPPLPEQAESSPKKKKRKKESKMSLLGRSELKQVFPDRFFG